MGGRIWGLESVDEQNCAVACSRDPPTLQAGIEDSAKSNAVMVGIGLDEVQQPANGLQYREASVGGSENSIAAGIPEESSGSQEPQQDPMEALAAYRKRVEQLVNRGQVCNVICSKVPNRSPALVDE